MAIKEIVMPDGRRVEIDEWLHWPQYSTVECAQASAFNLRAFTYVVGQTVPRTGLAARAATESDTNQVARARMNHDEAFIAFSWTYEVFALSSAADGSPPGVAAPFPMISGTNLRRLQRDLMIELYVGAGISKPMASCPLSWIGQGIGCPAWTSGDAVTGGGIHINYGTGGRPGPRNQRLWNLPIMIASDRVMYVGVTSPVGTVAGLSQDIRLRIWLDGLKRRPVA